MNNIRIVVIDDEPLVRTGIIMSYDWQSKGFTFVGEADDGVQGLELIKNINPDIAIVDIKMPHMNGIELIRAAKEYNKNLYIVVLSGYDDYPYIREAMKLGAYDYLLKLSTTPETLLPIFENIKKQILENRNIAIEQSDVSPNSVFEDLLSKNTQNSLFDFSDNVIIGCIRIQACTMIVKPDMKKFISIFESILKKNLSSFEAYVSYRGEYAWAVGINHADNNIDWQKMFSIICKNLNVIFSVTVVAGIYQDCTDEASIQDAYLQALKASKESFMHTGNQCFLYNPIYNKYESVFTKDESFEFQKLLEVGTCDKLLEFIETEKNKYKNTTYIVATSILNKMIYIILSVASMSGIDITPLYSSGTPNTMIEKLPSYIDAFAVIKDWALYVNNVKQDAAKNMKEVDIQIAKDYIARNIDQPISLSDVADYLKISPSYLSSIFSKSMGIGLVNYINQQKINKAIVLLEKTDLKVYEIAMNLGYSDEHYFSRLFKKITGKTPLELRG